MGDDILDSVRVEQRSYAALDPDMAAFFCAIGTEIERLRIENQRLRTALASAQADMGHVQREARNAADRLASRRAAIDGKLAAATQEDDRD